MGQITIGEQASPTTPSSGVVHYATIATPSLAKVKDDAGGDYSLALLEKAQTATAQKTFAPTTDVSPIVANTPAGNTNQAIEVRYNGTLRAYIQAQAASTAIGLEAYDNGASFGPRILVGRNNNASSPSAGIILFFDKSGDFDSVWVDDADQLRIWKNNQPTNATDLGGTVVGTQTSMAEAKLISNDLSVLDEVMDRIRNGAEAVRRFTYKSGAFNHEQFEGVVTDYSPAYGMDRDAEHPQGKSLNEIQIIGDLLRTVDWLVQRVKELEAKI